MPVIAPAYEEQIVESIPSEPHAEMIRLSGQKKVAEETLDGLYGKTDGRACPSIGEGEEGMHHPAADRESYTGMGVRLFRDRVFGAAPELL